MAQNTWQPLSIWSTRTPDLELAHHNFTIAMYIGIALFKDVVWKRHDNIGECSLEFGQPPSPIGF
jgi:hypothetical protein